MSLMSRSRLDISFSWLWSGVRTSGTFLALYGVHIGRWELEGVGEGACDGTLLICWLALACCLWFRLETEAEGEASAEAWWAGEGAFDKEFRLGPKRELIERLGGSIIRTCSQNNRGTRDWKWKQKTKKTKELVGGCKRKKGVAVPIVAFDERSTPSLTSKASLLSLRNTVENMASTCCSSPSSIWSLILSNNAGVAQSGITANSPPHRGRKISKKCPQVIGLSSTLTHAPVSINLSFTPTLLTRAFQIFNPLNPVHGCVPQGIEWRTGRVGRKEVS